MNEQEMNNTKADKGRGEYDHNRDVLLLQPHVRACGVGAGRIFRHVEEQGWDTLLLDFST